MGLLLWNRADRRATTQQYTQCLRCVSECLDIELSDPRYCRDIADIVGPATQFISGGLRYRGTYCEH